MQPTNNMLIAKKHEFHTAMPTGQTGIMFEFTTDASKALQFEGQELARIKRICHALAPRRHQQDRSYVHTVDVAIRNHVSDSAIANEIAEEQTE